MRVQLAHRNKQCQAAWPVDRVFNCGAEYYLVYFNVK